VEIAADGRHVCQGWLAGQARGRAPVREAAAAAKAAVCAQMSRTPTEFRRRATMESKLFAALLLSPFVAAVIYAGVHEYLRFKSDGPAKYGLVYDEKTGTTHITGIAEHEEGYDPEDFDPSKYNNPESDEETEKKTN
jgi:hypothetical protein